MIRELTFYPEFVNPLGLERSPPLTDLGRVVILVGKNGAGKSRYLRLVRDLLATAPRAAEERAALLLDPSLENVAAKNQRLAALDRLLESGGILVDGPAGPTGPTARDLYLDLTFHRDADGRRHGRFWEAYQSISDVTERAARALFNAQHPKLAASPAIVDASRDAEQLNATLALLLEKTIEPEVDPSSGAVHALLGGRRFNAAELSSGERILMTWAVLLHAHAAPIHDAILFIDEPEVHLHPDAMTRVLSRLASERVLGPRGQLWMATHSPVVLLGARDAQVLLVEEGTVRRSDASAPEVLTVLSPTAPRQVHLAPARLPVGTSDFQKLREPGVRYVDKTELIADVLRNPAEVLLFTRPRRFGKTMNQSMLRYFLEKTDVDRSHLFRDLSIWRDPDSRRHFQGYPVIDLTFKDVKAGSWSECRDSMAVVIARAFNDHRYLLEAGGELSNQHAALFDATLAIRTSNAQLKNALLLLSKALERHHGRRVVILIDEYDTPIQSAWSNDYYDEAIDFFRGFLSASLKDNPHLFKGILTGVLRVAKESLFSGLNNIRVYSLLQPEFASHFGFTEGEVTQLLEELGETSRLVELKEWYNGYQFGAEVIYNPWSVANFLNQQHGPPQPYWTDTSDDELLKRLLIYGAAGLHGRLRALLAGQSILEAIDEHVALRELDQRPDEVWGLLLFSGYLKPLPTPRAEQGTERRSLTLPNKEVLHAFEKLVRDNLRERLGGEDEVRKLIQALLVGDDETLQLLIERFLIQCMSPRSTAVKNSEACYEHFLLGVLTSLGPDHHAESQPSTGYGYADILIIPREPGQPGVALELKTLGKRKPEAALDAALQQIELKKYVARLEALGATPIYKYAVVFDGQRVWVRKAS